jgi:membrane-bound inhibitor of C-type lysozyme
MMMQPNYSRLRGIAALSLMLALAACGQAKTEAKPILYACDGGAKLTASYDMDKHRLQLTFGSVELNLNQTEADEGARFSDGVTTFWDHGPTAELQLAAAPKGITCHIQEQAALAP